MKETICSICGLIGGLIAGALGGIDAALKALLILMAVDYVSGLIVAGVFKRSPKTDTGALESRTGWKGLCRKGMTITLVLVAHYVDAALGLNYIRDGVCIAFMANELISIIENAGLMGVPLPKVLVNAVDILQKRSEMKGESKDGEN